MSIERFNITVRRALLAASAAAALIASAAFAQSQPSENGRNTFRGSTVPEPTKPDKERAVIKRSFEDRVDLKKATNVKAGTNASFDPQLPDQPDSSQAANDTAQRESVSRDLADLPEGSGVIMKGGKIVARAREEESLGRDTQAESRRADPPRERSVSQRKYKSLTGMTVVNSTGQRIGSIEDVVINNENGETSLLIKTQSMTGTGTVRVLAPMREVAVIGDDAVWDTLKTPRELRQSNGQNSEGYNRVSDSGAAPSNGRDEGVLQR